ncbi:MAG: hypothetical protein BWZ06_01273 [Bacteroidetes bacterium ADurb.BinA261]|nr:MAG: hypothetical protein BWZ06_01273 [Bacteroidetes bacterium ADurb.BinA261]
MPGEQGSRTDTLLRELKELATEDTIVTSSSGKEYRFNINEKMNDMNIKSLLLTGQLEKGRKDDLDYDNQIIEHEKWDAKRTCKHTTGYFAGIGPTGVYSHPKRDRLQTHIYALSFLLSAIYRGENPTRPFAERPFHCYMMWLPFCRTTNCSPKRSIDC